MVINPPVKCFLLFFDLVKVSIYSHGTETESYLGDYIVEIS